MDEKDKQEVLKYVQEIYDSRGCSGVEEWINNYKGSHKYFLLKIKKYISKMNGSGDTRLLGGLTKFHIQNILEMTILDRDEADKILDEIIPIYNQARGMSGLQKWFREDFKENGNKRIFLEKVIECLRNENQGGKRRYHSIGKSEKEEILDNIIL